MKLQSEPDHTKGNTKKDPRITLENQGVTAKEADFLSGECTTHTEKGKEVTVWTGQRYELNAMSSGQFLEWLKRKLDIAGVTKVVPEDTVMAAAYQMAERKARIKTFADKVEAEATEVPVPEGLRDKVRGLLVGEPKLSWDQALVRIASAESKAEK